jgi:hypothetical protein
MFGVKSTEILPGGLRKVRLRWWVYVLIAIPWVIAFCIGISRIGG